MPHTNQPFRHSFWKDFQNTIDTENFRGEGQYLSQLVGAKKEQYSTAYQYAKHIAPGILARLQEDGAFGAITFDIDGRKVSRDVIDSTLEIAFLASEIRLLGKLALDIGAGYGRFATRLLELFPGNDVCCLDAIPISTDICRRYVAHRKAEKAYVVPFEEIERCQTADIAVNIHSWSECTLEAIQFWIDFIVSKNVRWLFVVPHDDRFRARETNGSTPSFLPLILKHFDLVKQRPKYPEGVDGAFPTVYALFERKR